jgi:outer membrane lipoprotein-sorting protein
MRRTYIVAVVVALLAVVALTIGIVVARADDPGTLPSVSASELLFKMATTDHSNVVVNGTVKWTNDLLGQSGLVDTSHYGAAQSPLTGSGSGRFWTQDGNLRLESQGQGGDQVVVFNQKAGTAWVYTYAANTATEYTLPAPGAKTGAQSASPEPSPTGTFGPADIQKYIEQMASTAQVTVAGQTEVAGRSAYVLQLVPTATDTALGKVQVAVDGSTYLPLSLQVFPAGSDKATLSFSFDNISFERVNNDLFTFTPPSGTTVTHHDLAAQMDKMSAKAGGQGGQAWNDQKAADQKAGGTEPKPLTVAEAQAKADFTLVTPQNYESVRPFQGAWVVDQAQIAKQLKAFEQTTGGTGAQSPAPTPSASPSAGQPAQSAPRVDLSKLPQQAVAMQYGKGFGAIWFVQAPTTPELTKQLAKLPEQISKQEVAGHKAWTLSTPLGGAVIWQQGDVTLMAGGMVTSGDLADFVAAVQ